MRNKFYVVFFLMLIFICIFSVNNITLAKKFTDFSTNTDLYCLHRHWAFSTTKDYLTVNTYTIDNGYPDTTLDNIFKERYYKLAYILSRTGYSKGSIGGYAKQIALWRLQNVPESGLPSTSTQYLITEATTILNDAEKYKNFISNYNKPVLSKESNFTYSDGFAGPFKLVFYAKSVNGVTFGKPIKFLLTATTDNGGEYTTEITTVYNSSHNQISNLGSNTPFYIKIPDDYKPGGKYNKNNQELTLKAVQTGKITVEFERWSTTGYGYGSLDGNYIISVDRKSNTQAIYCNNCLMVHTLESCIMTDEHGDKEISAYLNEHCRRAYIKVNDTYECHGVHTPGNPDKISNVCDATISWREINFQPILKVNKVSKTDNSNSVKFKLLPPLEVTLKKTDKTGTSLLGAKFTVEVSQSGATKKYTVDCSDSGNGSFKHMPINGNDITLEITEYQVPTNYMKANTFTVKYSLNSNKTAWVTDDKTVENHYKVSGRTIQVRDLKKPKIQINLNKINTAGAGLNGSTFSVVAMQNNANLSTATISPTYSNNTWSSHSTTITPTNLSPVTVKITETTAPSYHIGLEKEIEITYTYNYYTEQWEVNCTDGNDKYSVSNSIQTVTGDNNVPRRITTVTVKNRPKTDFELIKLDEFTNGAIEGATFNVKIRGTGNIDSNKVFTFTTGNDGSFKLSDNKDIPYLEFVLNGNNKYNDIEITLTEVSVPTGKEIIGNVALPTYKLLDAPIVVTIKYNGTNKPTTTVTYNGVEKKPFVNEVPVVNGVTVTAYDRPVIHLGGKVWLDENNNGKIDNENGLAGRKVYLFKSTDSLSFERVTKDIYGNDLILETVSDEEKIKVANNTGTYTEINQPTGTYLFNNLPKYDSSTGKKIYYKIFYSYDGVNYIATDGQDQKAKESLANLSNIRELYNNRLKQVSNTLDLGSKFTINETQVQQENGTFKINYMNGSYDSWKDTIYRSRLITTLDYNQDIHANGKNVKDEFNMFSETKEYSGTDLTINCGLKEKTIDLSLQNDIYEATVSVNGKTTVYSYDDVIKTGENITVGSETGEEISSGMGAYELKLYTSDYEYDGDNKLNIYVTYAIAINNQEINNLNSENETAKVYEIADYYDKNCTLVSVMDKDGNSFSWSNSGTSTIKESTYNKVIITKTNDVIATLKKGERKIIYLTFKVNGEGKNIAIGEYNNIAEITKYGSDYGLVDKDSAPGNVEIDKIEDDTDIARPLVLTKDQIRAISGNVWEDFKTNVNNKYKYGNGIKDDNENVIKGIAVELYEVKADGTLELFKKDPDDTGIYKTDEAGNYEISGFKAGNYILKFKYNDSTYNGVFYKSAIVKGEHYDNQISSDPVYYNKLYSIGRANNDNKVNKGMDLGQERLEIIKNYSAMNNVTYWDIEDPEKRLMIATTPKIFVPIDVYDGEFKDTDGTTNVKWWDIGPLKIEGVNFAVEKRPETKITIEEHIKNLTLKANDGVSIVQAEAEDIDALFTGPSIVSTKGINKNLIAQRSNRAANQIGTWSIATDIDELVQGASIEAEVVYQVKNESDRDYLSVALVNAYTSGEYIDGIDKFIGKEIDSIKAIGKTFYTGEVDFSVKIVPVTVKEIQDYTTDLEFKKGNKIEKQKGTETGAINKTNKYSKAWATSEDAVNLENQNVLFDLFNGNVLVKVENALKNTSELKTLVKDGNIYREVYTKETEVKDILTGTVNTKLLPNEYSRELTATFGINGLTPTKKLEFDNYASEIMSYSTANGAPAKKAIPGDLKSKFVHIEDKDIGITALEHDEYIGEKIRITKPTGENQQNKTTLIIAVMGGIAIIVAGTVLIKKYVNGDGRMHKN